MGIGKQMSSAASSAGARTTFAEGSRDQTAGVCKTAHADLIQAAAVQDK